MGFLIQLLLEPLFAILSDVFWWLVPNEIERRNDRKRFLDGEVRCALRAVKGRVLNVPTEWSAGLAVISPGVLHFTPSIGIVGTRELRVVSIRDRDASISPGKNEYLIGGWLDFIVTTAAGELIVRFALEVGDAAAEVLHPHSAPEAKASSGPQP